MNTDKIIPYGRQNITEEDILAVVKTLQSEYLTQGPKIKEFEDSFAKYVGAKYAVALSNGTAALHLSMMALNLKEGSRVITSPITFAASANCVRYCGAEVCFLDINPSNYCIDIEKLEKCLAESPKGYYSGIIPIHFAGNPVDLHRINKLASKYGLWVVEDACHAPGGHIIKKNNEKSLIGSCEFSDMTIFSFHPVKHIACGEGGMITTNSQAIYNKLLLLRTHGITRDPHLMDKNPGGWYYEMQVLGYNYRLTDVQAALGISQLKRADEGLIRRKEIAKKYATFFDSKKYIIGHSNYVEGHAYHLYIIQVNDRKELYDNLKTKGIYCQVHYIPVHLHPYYKMLGWHEGDFKQSEFYYDTCLSIPMYPTLTDEEVDYIIKAIEEYYKG
jgi:UDP-4-amino-4,6-dideoxy-N-acetyl-beta-L-altrosamine transaminase